MTRQTTVVVIGSLRVRHALFQILGEVSRYCSNTKGKYSNLNLRDGGTASLERFFSICCFPLSLQ